MNEEIIAPATGIGRRLFLKVSCFFAVLASLPVSAWSFFISHLPVRTVEKDTFRFDPATGTIVWNDVKKREPYSLTVEGLVKKSERFGYAALRSFPQVTQVSDFHCVEGWSVRDVRWGGFRFNEIAKRVVPDPQAAYAIFHALGKTGSSPYGQEYYIESLPLKDLLDPKKECLLVLDMNGSPLTHDHGAPLRVISPYDLAYKSIKYVMKIEFARKPKEGWWTLANPIYSVNAPVPPERLRKKP